MDIHEKQEPAIGRVQECVEDLLKELAQRGGLETAWDPGELLGMESSELRGAVLDWLVQGGYLEGVGRTWRLTERGTHRAVELLRAHRLMETYLARTHGRGAEEIHAEADRAEHYMTVEKANELADMMNRPRYDPHGDPIPERAADLHQEEQVSLASMEEGATMLIAHIEDEPAEDFEELVKLGLAPELPMKVLRKTDEEVEIELTGERMALPQTLAAHVEVCPLPEGDRYSDQLRRLSRLKPGEAGTVEFISSACVGPERRRLQDFGMVPGSRVDCAFSSPFGSPMAYTVRGTTIGLRESQARHIIITREK